MLDVLLRQNQIEDARRKMLNTRVSALDVGRVSQILRKLKLKKSPAIGDHVKSWDVLKTIGFLNEYVSASDPILDIGAFSSEIIVSLYSQGYTNLAGVDLNDKLKDMPFAHKIRYEISDFMYTPFEDEAFSAITSISVIEHGFNGETLLKEMSRLLKPNGYFIASFDYWPEKIDTTGIKFFDLDWKIFSQTDVERFVVLAEEYGLKPVGNMRFNAEDAVINTLGKEYTFGWIVLKKSG